MMQCNTEKMPNSIFQMSGYLVGRHSLNSIINRYWMCAPLLLFDFPFPNPIFVRLNASMIVNIINRRNCVAGIPS